MNKKKTIYFGQIALIEVRVSFVFMRCGLFLFRFDTQPVVIVFVLILGIFLGWFVADKTHALLYCVVCVREICVLRESGNEMRHLTPPLQLLFLLIKLSWGFGPGAKSRCVLYIYTRLIHLDPENFGKN